MNTLKKFRSYKHLRKRSKVEKALHMANTIQKQTDPLRHLYHLNSSSGEGDQVQGLTMANTITFSARDGLSEDLLQLATKWGYKYHGNGGYTQFIADILESIVDKSDDNNAEFDLNMLVSKKLPKSR